jgi:WD40 repeat protein
VIAIERLPLCRFASASADATVRIWDRVSGACLSVVTCPNPIRVFRSLPNGHFLVLGDDQVWKLAEMETVT